MTNARYFLAGLPDSGKSSYLAAFWIYANNKTTQSALSVSGYPEDADYLDTLQKNWFGYTKVPRTTAGTERTVTIDVKRASDQQAFTLQIPDMAGESFDHIWGDRHWSDEFQAVADGAAGALLFIHPMMVEDGATLGQVRELSKVLPEEAAPPGAGARVPTVEPSPTSVAATVQTSAVQPSKPKPAPHDKNKAPTQIKLIENLQLLSEHAAIKRPFRLGLVVSAWDLVISKDRAAAPAGWLKARMPCLMQYLHANRDLYDTEIFGVSAQGGDYEKPADGFLEMNPYTRCQVAGASVVNVSDVTAPINWLLKL